MKENHATRVPTVLIGIGGIGGQIVRLVDSELKQYDKQFVQMLVLDTNTNDLSKSRKINIPMVQTSENMTVSDYLRQNTRFQEWFPMNPLINAKNLTQGAGQIRSVSRLGALASENAHRFDTVKQAIENVNRNVGDTLHTMIRVMIVGSVCGGTGSGMGIQLPFLVRDLIEEIAHMPRTIIRGLFIMPDIVESVQDTDEKKRAVYVNGYAFLRELNAFNLAQTFKRGTEKLQVEHYRRNETDIHDDPTQMAHNIPYDFLFLIEKSNINGQNIGGFHAYISKASQIVKAQLFASDMTADLHSSEDNIIVSAVPRDGKNRYCGAGISRAIYPEDENRRYCILRFSKSLLQGYWLRIDREVDINMAQHTRLMATNPSLMPKDPRDEFVAVFDKLTDPNQSEITAEMGQLKRELVFEAVITDERGKEVTQRVNCADKLVGKIESHVEDQFESQEMMESAKDCKMSQKKLLSDSAVTYCNSQLEMLRNYENKAKDRVGNLTAAVIDSILGADSEITKTYQNEAAYPYHISAVINKKHPIVARYILYYVRRKLLERIAVAEADIANIEDQKTIFQKDYYEEKLKNGEKDTIVEDPADALMRTKPGCLSVFGIKSAEYNRLVQTIVRDANAHIQRVNEYSKLTLKKNVYTKVLERLEMLIGVYEKFFAALQQILYRNSADIDVLEEAQDRIQNSDITVCSDLLCKRWLYDKFEEKINGLDKTLPDDIKQTFFDVMFKEYEKIHKSSVDRTAFTDAPLSMNELFESSILAPLTEKYRDTQMAHIHMDIISALKLEYNIHIREGELRVNGLQVDPKDFSFEDYFTAVASQLKGLSTPYLSYVTLSEKLNNLLMPSADVADIAFDPAAPEAAVANPTRGWVLCYWGINNGAVARHQHKEKDESIDRNALTGMFGMSDGETYFVVNDDSFDEKELTCYSSVYDLFIENLDKYDKNSTAYKEYTSRILRVIKSDFEVGTGASAYLDTVHPHLDRHWHSHAYLPMLRIDDELEEQNRTVKAFLLGIACRRVWYMQLDHTPCWAFRQLDQRLPKPLTIDGKQAERSSFYTLYQAIDENTVVVNDILRKVFEEENQAYNTVRIGGIKPEDILVHSIIAGLIGDAYTEEEMMDLETVFTKIYDTQGRSASKRPMNILRVIYSVYQDSYDLDLVTKLVDVLTSYLNGYCMKMTNKQKGAAGLLFKKIAKAIGANFKTEDVDMPFKMLCEVYLNE